MTVELTIADIGPLLRTIEQARIQTQELERRVGSDYAILTRLSAVRTGLNIAQHSAEMVIAAQKEVP